MGLTLHIAQRSVHLDIDDANDVSKPGNIAKYSIVCECSFRCFESRNDDIGTRGLFL